eukprot:gene40336-17109_t
MRHAAPPRRRRGPPAPLSLFAAVTLPLLRLHPTGMTPDTLRLLTHVCGAELVLLLPAPPRAAAGNAGVTDAEPPADSPHSRVARGLADLRDAGALSDGEYALETWWSLRGEIPADEWARAKAALLSPLPPAAGS